MRPEPSREPEPTPPADPMVPASDPSDEPGVRLRRTRPQCLLVVLGLLASLVSFASAGVVRAVEVKVSHLQRISLGSVLAPTGALYPTATLAPSDAGTVPSAPPAPSEQAMNILVVGVDNADGLAADDRRRIDRDDGLRSDTIMLLRLDPSNGEVALLSFPRDLWLPLGGDGGNDRINAALPLGGAELLIRTISENFGIAINHFIQVDFAQFEALVDAVGGIPFPFSSPVRDDNSGLYVGEAGCVLLDGSAALDYVRSRYLQRLVDGEWEADPSADLSRIRRQQDFLRRAFARAKDKGLSNPLTANRLIDAGISAITVDQGFGADLMVRLALRFRHLDPGSLPTFSLPVTPETTSGGAAVLRLQTAAAAPVFDLFRGIDPYVPSAVRVSTDADAALRSALSGAGFVLEPPTGGAVGGSAASPAGSGTVSRITFASDDRYRAELLADWLDGPTELVETDDDPSGTVTLQQAGPLTVRTAARTSQPAWAAAATASAGFLPAGTDLTC